MGHVHLHVRDVPEAEAFYAGVLGFDRTVRLGTEATFLSAGGYHHHLGANVWAGRGVTPPPPGSAALRHFTIVLPDEAERDRVAAVIGGTEGADPSGNRFVLQSP
jgi:catechol 2,3-dioxygenase